jgi:uncharacterized phiE125 gp8 family phage protein
MILKRTVAPAAYPVTVAESKADLRVQHTAEDTLIDSLIAAATDYADVPNGVVGKALITQTWTLSVRSFEPNLKLHIPITPVQSISSITYYDADNVQQSLTVFDFYLYGDEDTAWIEPKPNVTLPTVYPREDAITVTFVAGFGATSASVPNSIRQAIRLLVAHWYENRTAATDRPMYEIPMAAETLFNINRKGWVA